MNETIVAVGGGGYNVAGKVRKVNLFAEASVMLFDTDGGALKKNATPVEKISEMLPQTADTIILCTTLGGLTGSAYAPVVAHEARRAGKFVCSLFAMPWDFEGEERNRRATAARAALLAASNLAIQQNNDRLRALRNGRCSMYDFMEDQGLLDVLNSVLSGSRTFEEWATVSDQENLQALIPERYRLPSEPYIEIHVNGYSALAE